MDEPMKRFEMNVVAADWTQVELIPLFFGWEVCEPNHYWGPGVRDSTIIHYVHEGRGTVIIAGKEYHLGRGQGFLIQPDILILLASGCETGHIDSHRAVASVERRKRRQTGRVHAR